MKSNECKQAYILEKRGYAFLDIAEVRWLAEHIKNHHPDEWPTCRLNITRP